MNKESSSLLFESDDGIITKEWSIYISDGDEETTKNSFFLTLMCFKSYSKHLGRVGDGGIFFLDKIGDNCTSGRRHNLFYDPQMSKWFQK